MIAPGQCIGDLCVPVVSSVIPPSVRLSLYISLSIYIFILCGCRRRWPKHGSKRTSPFRFPQTCNAICLTNALCVYPHNISLSPSPEFLRCARSDLIFTGPGFYRTRVFAGVFICGFLLLAASYMRFLQAQIA